MKFLKNIDAYLLRHFPSVWITRVHFFLPLGLAVVCLIFFFNVLSGWNPKDDLPNGENFVIFMIIPVIIYLVYWFIFQSRYNVLKSGGKVNIFQEYLNLILYASVFFVAFLFLMAIPFSNNQKISFSVGYEAFQEDAKNLNRGNGIVNGYEVITDEGNGIYKFQEENFINYWNVDLERANEVWVVEKTVKLTKREVLMRIEDFVSSYNKYTRNEIDMSPEEILEERLDGNYVLGGYDFEDYYYSYNSSSVSYKMNRLNDIYYDSNWTFGSDEWFWRVTIGVVFWLALVVWIFKQMNLRHFVLGLIAICLTPLVVGIFGAIFFMAFRGPNTDEYALNLVLFAYAAVTFIVVRGYLQSTLNQWSYVLTMFLHFWLIILPLFVYLRIIAGRHYSYYYNGPVKIAGMDEEVFIYWLIFAVGMISLIFFKPLYSKFRTLPMHK